MQFQLTNAADTLKDLKLKMSIQGVSGSGKTYTALAIASGLGGKIAVIDTERGKSALYAKKFPFDVVALNDHTPNNYIQLINHIEEAGYSTIIIDSFSHSWMGKNGMLDQKEIMATRHKVNDFQAWSKVAPLTMHLMDVILGCKVNVIATMRTKKEYLIDRDERNKQRIQVVGTTAIQKSETEYEFDLNAEMDVNHNLIILKTRFLNMKDNVYPKPDHTFSEIIQDALSNYDPVNDEMVIVPKPIPAVEEMAKEVDEANIYISGEQYTALYKEAKSMGWDDIALRNALSEFNILSFKTIPIDKYELVKTYLMDPHKFDNIEGM